MQTFLPYADMRRSVQVLDARRLGKQRVECLQVLRGLTVPDYGWRHHPAVRMWAGRLEALGRYTLECCAEWAESGRADTVADTVTAELASHGVTSIRDEDELARTGGLPPWWGKASVHESHRSALVRKDPEHYRRFFPDVPDDLPYVWPPGAD